ncbi:hypothetical protein [Halorubrum distributum]|uniref:Uncharacterized protein n=1 Tax=Halorubrum distributum TaxID=29283 RepID=A0A6B1IMY5_9EURY|nr:hypothetical protein [Halorubrum terrestre]MYL68630.1 hypothetical protein [Halorubrum terrestre]
MTGLTGTPTTFDDHDPLANDIYEVLKSFIDEVGSRGCAAHFDKVVRKQYYLKGRHLTQEPERFIEDHLVFPVLKESLGHDVRPRPKQYAPRWPRQGGIPDFCLTTIPVDAAMDAELRVFGEVKPAKKIESARRDMREYLNSDVDLDAVAILTDGFDWELWVRPQGERVNEDDDPHRQASLRDPLKAISARNMEVDTSHAYGVRDHIDTEKFSSLTTTSIRKIITAELGVTELT